MLLRLFNRFMLSSAHGPAARPVAVMPTEASATPDDRPDPGARRPDSTDHATVRTPTSTRP
jgi:hypothetical protein